MRKVLVIASRLVTLVGLPFTFMLLNSPAWLVNVTPVVLLAAWAFEAWVNAQRRRELAQLWQLAARLNRTAADLQPYFTGVGVQGLRLSQQTPPQFYPLRRQVQAAMAALVAEQAAL
ncbi:hypothetical protein [Lacticaseibacillus daqingensis]|uniref:hypothetical protein n=1 Tax=Lacticaseibacillus daqingensis TaxID=2486014 RepID=UPI000F77AA2F|nr:hypothetical protein [Lacticaseibacillus daqingensis]